MTDSAQAMGRHLGHTEQGDISASPQLLSPFHPAPRPSFSAISPFVKARSSSPVKLVFEDLVKGTGPSPSKTVYKTTTPDLFADTKVPSMFDGRGAGARLMRERIIWILESSKRLALDRTRSSGRDSNWIARELARVTGRKDEWWRTNSAMYHEEQQLELHGLPSFQPFCGANRGTPDPSVAEWYAFIQHYKLCRHEDSPATCIYHRALLVFHTYRAPRGSAERVPLPSSFDLDSTRDEWLAFATYYDAKFGKRDEAEAGSVSPRKNRSLSPRKRRYFELGLSKAETPAQFQISKHDID